MTDKRILVIHSSPGSGRSVSRTLVGDALKRLRAIYPTATVMVRDLVLEPLPHFGATEVAAVMKSADSRTRAETEALALSDVLCRELLASDIILIGSPMWNFGVPSVLKAWVDHVVRAGVTFRYTEYGPTGILPPEMTVILVESTGALYSIRETQVFNHVGPWLSQIFRFLGAEKINVISAQGTVTRGAEIALADGRAQLDTFFRNETSQKNEGQFL